jgi:hypothetical protein
MTKTGTDGRNDYNAPNMSVIFNQESPPEEVLEELKGCFIAPTRPVELLQKFHVTTREHRVSVDRTRACIFQQENVLAKLNEVKTRRL